MLTLLHSKKHPCTLFKFLFRLLFLLGMPMLSWAQDPAFNTQITSPAPGSTLTATTLFQWGPQGTGNYFLEVGTTGAGSSNIYSSPTLAAGTSSVSVAGIPTTGAVYVRLWVERQAPNTGSYVTKNYVYNIDVDDDGIKDTIDPNPGVANAKTTLVGSDFTMKILGSGRVASLESPTLFASTVDDTTTPEVQSIAQRIYQKFNDDFDFIFVASNRTSVPATATAAGIHHSASNAVGGIGQSVFNNAAGYGSAGKLQSYLHLATLDGLLFGPSLHELMHRWGNNLAPVIPGAAGDSAHWGYSSVGGQLGGYLSGSRELVSGSLYRAKSPRTGAFGGWGTFANGGNGLPYSKLELYLMGMIDKTAVTDVLEVANGVTNFNAGTGEFNATSFTTVTMADITSAKGERNPTSPTAQKNFRCILVVLTDTALTNPQWAVADETVQKFALAGDDGTAGLYNFWEATGGRGTLTMDNLNASLKTTSSNADLSALSLSVGSLSPAFAASTTAYTASVPAGTAGITATPTRAQANATLQVRVNGGSYSAVTSGSASGNLPLLAGWNLVDVLVTAQDTTTKVYSVTVFTLTPISGSGYGLIPDNNGGNRDITFTVSGRTGTVTNVLVDFTLSPTHAYASDVVATLIGPDNTQHQVFGTNSNLPKTLAGPYLFSDDASITLSAGAGVPALIPTGRYRTQNSASVATSLVTTYNGKVPNGTWTLRFIDNASPDTGTVSAANLYLSTTGAVLPTLTTTTQTSVSYNSAVLGGNVTADGGASVSERGIVWAITPTPTIANTKVPNGSGTGTFSGTVSGFASGSTIYVRSYATNSIGTSYGNQISFTTLINTNLVTYPGTGYGLIPDGSPTGRDILFNVSGQTGVVKDVTVEFTLSPAHTYVSDLRVQLISPDGFIHGVFGMVTGDDSDLGGPYIFNDAAATGLASAAVSTGGTLIPTGTYRTEFTSGLTSLRISFGGKNPNGTWKLRFQDLEAQDSGTVSSANLTLSSAAPGKIALQRQINGQILLNLTLADPSANYELMRSTNLQTWTSLQALTTNGTGAATFTDPAPPAVKGFYRFVPRP